MSSFIRPDGEKIWFPNQIGFCNRFKEQVCDERWGSFVNLLRHVASGETPKITPFCPWCMHVLCRFRNVIMGVYGRTYYEMASHIWKYISLYFCNVCAFYIANIPCMILGPKCPSADLILDLESLLYYLPKKFNKPWDAADNKKSSQLGNILSVLPNLISAHNKEKIFPRSSAPERTKT
jgi:hypothetical protein